MAAEQECAVIPHSSTDEFGSLSFTRVSPAALWSFSQEVHQSVGWWFEARARIPGIPTKHSVAEAHFIRHVDNVAASTVIGESVFLVTGQGATVGPLD